MRFSRQEYWSGLPFPSPVNHILSGFSTMTRPSWVALWAWLGFTELDKAVVLVWLDWLVFCEYGFSVSALWCPLATLTILLGFLLPWTWDISSRLLQLSTAAVPYLGRGYLLTATVPDIQCGIAPLGPPVPVQPPLLGLLLLATGPGYLYIPCSLFMITVKQFMAKTILEAIRKIHQPNHIRVWTLAK